jgi:hypothetical protein
MSKATEDVLSDLHAELAKHLKDVLTNGEETGEQGEKIVKPATLNVIRQFLKDNEITAVNTPRSPLGDLTGSLPVDFDFDED